MYICIYVYIYIYIYIYISLFIYLYIYTHTTVNSQYSFTQLSELEQCRVNEALVTVPLHIYEMTIIGVTLI